MNGIPDPTQEYLIRFRTDLLKAIEKIDIEIRTLQLAVQEGRQVSLERLGELRQDAKKQGSSLVRWCAENIAHPLIH
jgi:hypothetical protein